MRNLSHLLGQSQQLHNFQNDFIDGPTATKMLQCLKRWIDQFIELRYGLLHLFRRSKRKGSLRQSDRFNSCYDRLAHTSNSSSTSLVVPKCSDCRRPIGARPAV